MRVIRDPGLRSLRHESIHLYRHSRRCSTALNHLYSNLPIYVLECTYFRTTRPTTCSNSDRARSDMSTPVRKSPQSLARDKRLLIIRYADEFGVCRAALNADPVKIGGYVGARDGVVNLVGPKQALAGAVVGVKGCCPGALEVGIFGLPDVVGCTNGTAGLRSIGAVFY
jgi:hypothetical protein